MINITKAHAAKNAASHHDHLHRPDIMAESNTIIMSLYAPPRIMLARSKICTSEGLGLAAQMVHMRRRSVPFCAAWRQRGNLRGADPACEIPGGTQACGLLLPLQFHQRLHKAFQPSQNSQDNEAAAGLQSLLKSSRSACSKVLSTQGAALA